MIAFHGSSFCLYPFTAQSNVENSPPQTPKFPPRTGARALIADNEPTRRSPCCAKQDDEKGRGRSKEIIGTAEGEGCGQRDVRPAIGLHALLGCSSLP